VAAGVGALTPQRDVEAVARKALSGALDAEKLRHTGFVGEQHFDAAPKQAGVHLIAHADANIRRNLEAVRRFQHNVRDCIGDIIPGSVRPAELQVSRVAQQQASDMKNGFLVGQGARRDLALVVRRKQHVQPSQRAAAVVHPRQHLVPQYPLARLAEGNGRFCDQSFVHRGGFGQILPPRGVRLRVRHRACSFGMTANPVLRPQDDILEAAVEIGHLRA